MGVLTGLLSGFSARKSEIETENLRRAEAASEREGRIFEALLSSPDPEIQAMAATGLLESAQPRKRKGGIRGWMGELETSPTFERLQALIKEPTEISPAVPAQIPRRAIRTQVAMTPPRLGEAPAGMPAQALTQPGATVNAPTPAPDTSGAISPTVGAPPPLYTETVPGAPAKPAVMGPRQLFMTPEQQATATAKGQYLGRARGLIEAMRSAQTPEERQIALELAGFSWPGAGGGFQSIPGQMPDGTPAFGVFDRQLGQYVDPQTRRPLTGFQPRTTTGSTSMGADRESLSRQLFNKPAAQLNPEQMAIVNQQLPQFAGTMAEARGLGTGRARTATELNMPIGPTAAQLYNVSPTMTLRELGTSYIGLNDTQKDRIYALGQLDVMIDDIEAGLPKVFPNVTQGIGGAIRTALSLGMQRLGRDADLAALDAAIQGAVAQIAQLTGQPGSRLSDQDLKRAEALLASLRLEVFGGDTLATARARLGVVRDLMAKAQAATPSPRVAAPPPGATPPSGPSSPPQAGSAGPAGYTVDKDGNLFFNGQPMR